MKRKAHCTHCNELVWKAWLKEIPDEFCNSWETNSPDDDADMAEPADVLLCVCQSCGFPEEGEAFQICPICGSERVHVSHLDADEISDFWHDFDDCREPAGVGRLVSL